MDTMDSTIDALRTLIVESLMLDDVVPGEILVDAPLFGEGLGLDSIDALELAMAIHQRFGVRIEADSERNREIFGSVRALAAYVHAHAQKEA
jgi:acyl carrier protein